MTRNLSGAMRPALIVLATLALSACSTIEPQYSVPPETAGGTKPAAVSAKSGTSADAHSMKNHGVRFNQ